MDLIARVAKNFEDSAQTKLHAVDAMSAPIAAAPAAVPYAQRAGSAGAHAPMELAKLGA